ncbi:MAG: bifunctional oligoribonuclease/PAP phosphatase NrnA, partial [Actinobacteria bacterium]|nr:bifunctional oligoribonuclease/PAP phosphatase NrnA [Actinomycetota bacterium]
MDKQEILSQNFEKSFAEVQNIIKNNDNFLIITHDFPDGDCLGSQLALYELLKSLDKKVSMLCNSDIPYQYKFLPHIDKINRFVNDVWPECMNKDCVCICLDSADENRFNTDLKKLKDMAKTIINIDHHLGNTEYGDINIIATEKSATAEIVYELLMYGFEKMINFNIAISLYTGIITDTGKFQYENTTHQVHKIVSDLLKYGVVPSDVFSFIYENEPFNRFKLLELVLKRIKLVKSKKIIYSYVMQKDFKRLCLPFSANDGVIEILRSAADARVAALFKQVGNNKF